MKTIKIMCSVLSLFLFQNIFGQVQKEFTNIDEALKQPEKVFRLNLSNQNLNINAVDWQKFNNLEYLNLSNDHLKSIPNEITLLKNLKTLDLSNNDFYSLPQDFGKLTNLNELFLNNEKNLKLEESVTVLIKLPNLKTLHLENDNLSVLPNNFNKMKSLEQLYLNHNKLKNTPKQLKGLDHLQYLDLNDNQIKPNVIIQEQNLNFGFKINFK